MDDLYDNSVKNIGSNIRSEQVVVCENLLDCSSKAYLQFLSQNGVLLSQFSILQLGIPQRGLQLV